MSARVLVVQSDPTDPPGLVGVWLAECGIDLDLIAAHAGEPVPDAVPAGYAGLLCLGGAMSAWSDEQAPWLPATRALLRDAVARRIPVLGLCLGGQLLALALGGEVRVGEVAEVGVVRVHLTAEAATDRLLGPVLAAVPDGVAPASQWHGDAVTSLPDGCVLLATNQACPVQAFRAGESAWGLQFHPEVDVPIVGSWVGDDGPMRRAGRVGDDVVGEVAAAMPDLVRAWRPLAHAWAGVVLRAADPPSVPRPAPPPSRRRPDRGRRP